MMTARPYHVAELPVGDEAVALPPHVDDLVVLEVDLGVLGQLRPAQLPQLRRRHAAGEAEVVVVDLVVGGPAVAGVEDDAPSRS